jgi:SAM-dependent methyltransferase
MPDPSIQNALRRRQDMTSREQERWRPPVYSPVKTPGQRLFHAIRCYFDVQAGSVWNDLAAELPHARGRVLDVGCGSQPYRSLLPSDVDYVGIDIAEADAHFGYKIPDTIYYQGDVWPIDDNSVDYILCTETMEHVPDPVQFLGQAARVLRPGGTVLLTVPFAARWHFIPYDFWRYTPSTLKRLLVEAGFTDVAVYARGNALTVACYKVMALILPLLFPQDARFFAKWLLRLLGLVFLPLFLILAIIANFSLKSKGGDDCLGYTCVSNRNEMSQKC